MPLRWLDGWLVPSHNSQARSPCRTSWVSLLLVGCLLACADAMTPRRIAELRHGAVDMFYHGFDAYMEHAFPEDELRPVSCIPLTRDPHNPKHVEINDVLGNYSLTLIDSLSTLAILASSPPDKANTGAKALRDFQDGVQALVAQYGDGTDGSAGRGLRARGFDLDSKVQVFETVIRGVGGLLSAHLFAVGELPIAGYEPTQASDTSGKTRRGTAIVWPNGLGYNGQLLRLALDLAERLLPAFYTDTGMPYPRVNLRYGIPFYQNSPLNRDTQSGQCERENSNEITETCSAGAGSLVLEFTVLSRLTGDPRFEQLAKRAFWAVWSRRSTINLIGAGIDAEEGHWIGSYAGIGAGADSFFEYALKTHILLSGHDLPNTTVSGGEKKSTYMDPNTLYRPLTDEENSSESFLIAWNDAHTAIKRHLYSNTHHPHYVNAHLGTGSPQAYWIDSLGAYYPGLLTLAGEVEEAIETNLLYTALWTRYSALPERWSVRDGHVEGGLGWWPGRPEFIESNYHLYRATGDPWYLHVGEMVLEDIRRRCWTDCGWSGLQDVRTGEKSDRMESFFLGETAKYMYLLFDPSHPLNSLDAPYVFTTEGHPLIIPRKQTTGRRTRPKAKVVQHYLLPQTNSCPVPPSQVPFTISATAARHDIFHAASLIGLQHIENIHAPRIETDNDDEDGGRFVNHTIYPWTLPATLVPDDGFCASLPLKTTFSIEFPSNLNTQPSSGFNVVLGPQGLVRLSDRGILVKSLQGIKFGLVLEDSTPALGSDGNAHSQSWRIFTIGNIPMGRDEKVYIQRDVIGPMSDPSFTRVRDGVMLDLILEIPNVIEANHSSTTRESMPIGSEVVIDDEHKELHFELDVEALQASGPSAYKTMLSSLLQHVTSALRDPVATLLPAPETKPIQTFQYLSFAATSPTGQGAAPIPDVTESLDLGTLNQKGALGEREALTWNTAYFVDQACDGKLPEAAARAQLIIMRRGGCSFSKKLANVPSFMPSAQGLRFLIVVSDDEEIKYDEDHETEYGTIGRDRGVRDMDAEGEARLIRPLLDEPQRTPAGLLRRHQISMVLIGGGEAAYETLKKASSVGLRRRYHIESQGLAITNIVVA